jgi:hypothetical protein
MKRLAGVDEFFRIYHTYRFSWISISRFFDGYKEIVLVGHQTNRKTVSSAAGRKGLRSITVRLRTETEESSQLSYRRC